MNLWALVRYAGLLYEETIHLSADICAPACDLVSAVWSALPTDQMQTNKLPFQIKQMQTPGFERLFDIFDT
jgi:hypothetical protein